MVRALPSSKVALVILALASACGEHATPPAPGRGGISRESQEGPLSDPMGESAAAAPRRAADDEEDTPSTGTEDLVVHEAQTQEVRVRDLSHELRTAYGDPGRCLGSLPAGVSSVTVTVTGTVFEDGVVSGARVSSSYVDGAVLQCLRGMASSLRIEGGVPEAPRVVTATLEVQR